MKGMMMTEATPPDKRTFVPRSIWTTKRHHGQVMDHKGRGAKQIRMTRVDVDCPREGVEHGFYYDSWRNPQAVQMPFDQLPAEGLPYRL